jgi:cell division inhibitor SepF
MPGAMRKMAVYLGLVEEDDDPDRYGDDEWNTDAPEDRESHNGDEISAHPAAMRRRDQRAVSFAATGAHTAPQPALTDLARITALHPRTYNEARTIGEHFRSGTPVIMNLTEMTDPDAKRLVDFAAGLIFGLHGAIERITNKVFLLSPAGVEVAAEDKARIAEGGFFNQS